MRTGVVLASGELELVKLIQFPRIAWMPRWQSGRWGVWWGPWPGEVEERDFVPAGVTFVLDVKGVAAVASPDGGYLKCDFRG